MYKPLPCYDLPPETAVYRPAYMLPGHVTLDDPAILVMTDLSRVMPITIAANESIETANYKMIACGVRLLFVTDDDGLIHGIITASDILGEKPVKYLHANGGTRRAVRVEHIMTPREKLDTLTMTEVVNATVGDIVETLKAVGRQHLLAIEQGLQGAHVRGLFSSSQIGRQLGIELEPHPRARTFAELGQALIHGVDAAATP
jgi:CBS domain containing-hemolysin-like protein